MSAGDVDILDRPINVAHARLSAARAMLDVLLELSYADDADARLESLGARSLSALIHTVIEQIDVAAQAVDRIASAPAVPIQLQGNQTKQ